MNATTIEFSDLTWNPIVGCSIGCSYCYAKRLNDRFNKTDFATPVFHPERLEEPYKRKKPANIFVGSMCDIFSRGVKDEWINKIIKVVRDNPHHTFQFLSKRPMLYSYYDFPKNNVWLGTSIDYSNKAHRVTDLKSCGCTYVSFVLVEPLLSSMQNVDFSAIDFMFVGAMTGPGAIAPQPEWIQSIKHHNIIWKENIKPYLKKS